MTYEEFLQLKALILQGIIPDPKTSDRVTDDSIFQKGTLTDTLNYLYSSTFDEDLALVNTNPAIYADGKAGRRDPLLTNGWYYKNDGNNEPATALDKINWYFYAGNPASPLTLGGLTSMFVLVDVKVAGEYPFFVVYTFPEGDGNDAQPWYRSRKVYSVGATVEAGTMLLYTGTDPGIYPEVPRIQLTESGSSEGPQASTENVFTMALNTNSAAAPSSVEFVAKQLGYASGPFVRELELATASPVIDFTTSYKPTNGTTQVEIVTVPSTVVSTGQVTIMSDDGNEGTFRMISQPGNPVALDAEQVTTSLFTVAQNDGILKATPGNGVFTLTMERMGGTVEYLTYTSTAGTVSILPTASNELTIFDDAVTSLSRVTPATLSNGDKLIIQDGYGTNWHMTVDTVTSNASDEVITFTDIYKSIAGGVDMLRFAPLYSAAEDGLQALRHSGAAFGPDYNAKVSTSVIR